MFKVIITIFIKLQFRFATEAAISILRIDDMIKLAPEKEELP